MQARFVVLAAGLLAVIPLSVAGQVRPTGRSAFGAKRQIVALHDRDGDGRLDNEERRSARAALRKEREKMRRARGGPRRRPGRPPAIDRRAGGLLAPGRRSHLPT